MTGCVASSDPAVGENNKTNVTCKMSTELVTVQTM